MEAYMNYQPSFDPSLFTNMPLEVLQQFATVFYFKKSTIFDCRRELSLFVKNVPKFYGDSLEEIFRKMIGCLSFYNQQNCTAYPYINWIPAFGGLLKEQDNEDYAQTKFMIDNRVPYYLTNEVPSLVMRSERCSEQKMYEQFFTGTGPICE